jgi:hypothetical protein
MILGRGQKLASKRKTITVEIPELECSVILRELSWKGVVDSEGDLSKRLALMIVDETGELVYQTPEEIESLADISAAAYARLIMEAGKLNKSTADAVEGMAKNSQASPDGSSASSSLAT